MINNKLDVYAVAVSEIACMPTQDSLQAVHLLSHTLLQVGQQLFIHCDRRL